MISRQELRRINRWLLDKGGYVEGRVDPKFRIVWGPSVICNRVVYDINGESLGFQERPKYQYIAPDAYVLECYFTKPDPETGGTENGCYEPLHVFYDKEGNPVDPDLNAIQFWMVCLETGMDKIRHEPKTESDFVADSQQKYEIGWKRIYDYLNADSFLQHQLQHGSAVSFGGVKQLKGD